MQVAIKGAIWAVKYSWSENLFYEFSESGHNDPRYVKVADHEFTVEVPDDFDMRPGMVANLEREKEQVKAEFTARVTQINAQIQSLLAIEA